MSMDPHLGLLLRTGSLEEALACATLMTADVIRHHNELRPNTRVLIDTDLIAIDEAVRIGQRFRSLGVELIVTARLTSEVPFALRRNLTGLRDAPSQGSPGAALPHE